MIKATNKDDLCDRLEELQQQLVLCEKALAEYLETKRLFFPRFYFVSSADLLDILSIGNQPKLVMKHLTKLFDSIAKLELAKNENNEISALGMYAKDGEYVPFDISTESAMTCVGPVEIWLNKVQLNMRASLRSYMGNAVVTYEEKPRDSWLFEYVTVLKVKKVLMVFFSYPAQVSLCGTQIWWTTEGYCYAYLLLLELIFFALQST